MKAFHSLLTDLKTLSDEEFGIFMRGCLRYSETGEIPVFGDRLLDTLFATQKRLIDEADESYESISEKRTQAARARWDANASTCMQMDANDANASKTKTKTRTKTNPSKEGVRRFTPPTSEEVAEYCKEKGYAIDPERFVSFYAQKGWMVGKNRMVDWRAAVRNWVTRDRAERAAKAPQTQYSNEELEKFEVDLLGGDFSW